ncbi:MAG: hypothetical protein MN733_42940, partial [Nitrososphaera sp.]|nr:hypothetical protein [Nitrososphaera sp.]
AKAALKLAADNEKFCQLATLRLGKALAAIRSLEKLAAYKSNTAPREFVLAKLKGAVVQVADAYANGLKVGIEIPRDAPK